MTAQTMNFGNTSEPQTGVLTNAIAESAVVVIDLDAFRDAPAVDIDALENAINTGVEGAPRMTIARRLCVATSTADAPSQSKLLLIQRHYEAKEHLSREDLRMHLASDLTAMHLRDGFCQFVLVGNDPCFATLAAIVKKSASTRIHCLGAKPREHTSVEFIKAFDSFMAYPDVVQPLENKELKDLRTQYARSLVYTVWRLQERGSKAVGAAIVPLLRDKHPELSPRLLEFTNYEDLADFACEPLKLVKNLRQQAHGDFELALTKKGEELAKELAGTIEAKNSKTETRESLKSAIREIIGIELPEQRQRTQIFNTAHWLLTKANRDHLTVSLVALSYAIAEQIDSPYVTQNIAYRLIFGLYRAGALDHRQNPANKNDPELVRVRIDQLHMDDAFVMNILYMQKKYPVFSDSAASEIASVFYGNPDSTDKIDAIRRIVADPSFDRGSLPAIAAGLGSHS